MWGDQVSTTIYGSTVNHWRSYITYDVSSTSTTTTITVSAAGIESVAWGFEISSGISATLTCNGSSSSGSGGLTSSYGSSTKNALISSKTYSVTKSTSTQSVSLSLTVTNSSGYMDGTSTASTSITVDALESYTIKYNANGGSGAPSSQTKSYGKTLTLSTTKPSRSLYDFLGWSTSKTATSATYAAGGSYTANAAATLYAVWELAYTYPVISNLSVYRANSSGTATDDGTYCYVSYKWSVDSSYAGKTATIGYKTASASSYTTTSVTLSGTSGTVTKTIGGSLSVDSSYNIQVTVTDTHGGSGTAASSIGTASYALDFHAGGKGIGIARAASSNYLDIGTRVRVYDNYVSQRDSTLDRDAFPTDSTLNSACRWMIQDKDGDVASQIRVYQTTSETNRVSMRVYTDVDGTETSAGIAAEIASDGTRYVRPDTSSTYLSNYNQTNALFPTTSTTLRTATPYRVYGCSRLHYNSSGTTGTITLSETCANYAFVDVYYGKSSGPYWQHRLWSPNGKKTTLEFVGASSDTSMTCAACHVEFSATSVTISNNREFSFDTEYGIDLSTTGSIRIYGVWGWKG